MKDVAIVSIGYKEHLNNDEIISLERCLKVFNTRDIFMVVPDNLSTIEYETIALANNAKITFVKISPIWLESISNYSKLLIQNFFYEYFNEYKYILIYQLDCYVFKDNLDYFIEMDYNYYGAVWTYENLYKVVGNGGLSLRKITAFLENIKERKDLDFINSEECSFVEDYAFCNGFYPIKNRCPFNIAEEFSFETSANWRKPEQMTINDFPMGLHGFSKDCFKDVMGRMIIKWKELNNE